MACLGAIMALNGVTHLKIKGRHDAYDQLDRFCCTPGCKGDIAEDAPVPLCGDHMRIAFAHVLMGAERMSAEVVETVAQEAPTPKRQRVGARRLTTAEGYVYFIRFASRIKIGWSANPQVRLRHLPHDEVLAIVPGTLKNERQCHLAFAHLRVTGEWFQAESDLLDFIADLPKTA